ncbi:LamG-like jellyroll fold domain-containing protein [Streptomyces sp. DSM 41527]|uniref:LamG-like jellyroll fold domain-containing protein n=1 Tax=Streptomyces mooreae TaxID=3075523 RepID=A0ABU2T8H9_9ACTN|nr:LamG-like jellyroll fold domain-containing protein [Streptomyces sp. DSM 41527]MDT0457237.1 LamG-like jellyroll fold domain-containing protein [Streptomyces sp. DSM 41527]
MKLHSGLVLPLAVTAVLATGTPAMASSDPLAASPAGRGPSVRSAGVAEEAAFSLDEDAGSRRVLGGTAREFTAELGGGAEPGAVGKVGTALKLNGTSAYAATAGPVIDTTESFSVSAWVKLDAKDRNQTFLSQAGNRASGFQLYYSKAYDKWVFNQHTADTDGPDLVRAVSKDVAQSDEWTHLTGSYDADKRSLSLFVNGRLQQSVQAAPVWRATGGLQIGRLRSHGAWKENAAGAIDEVRAVQSAVTQADATALSGGRLPEHLQELASFPLDESAGATQVSGGMGAGPVATLAGGGAQLGVPGKVGTALKLNGTTAYAATAGPVVDTTKSFSVSAWVKLEAKDRNQTFLSQAGNRASGFQLYYSKAYDKWVFNRHTTDSDDTTIARSISSDTAQTGVWTHLTGVYDSATKKVQLFVNGKPQTAADFTTPWRANGGLQIGRLHYQGTFQEHFAGAIDNIRIWDETVLVGCSRTNAIGHRGAPEIAPENTLASLEAAADRGADRVETDVQFTKDGRPVIMHDATVDRTTDGTGRVDELTAEEISRLTVKGGGRVPTLEQVLTSLKDRPARLLLEIKGPQSSAAVDRALGLVAEAGMTDRTLLQSFDEQVVRDASASPHRTKVALLRSALDADPVATARQFSLSAYAVKFSGLSARPAAVDKLRAAGVEVFVWTADTEAQWQTATAWGVDGVITNRADHFVQWRNAHCSER